MNPILVVDDEFEMRAALKEVLSRDGYDVEAVSSGPDALKKVHERSFALLITDVKMPRMNGLELLREVRRQAPALPVLMMTAYGTIEDAVEAMREGARDYVLKPFTREMLSTVVRRAVEGDRPDAMPGGGNGRSRRREFVTQDPGMQKILARAKNVAPSRATVLITGESGTGKELLAAFIHENSPRREKPFVAVNCAALPEGLLESELFGHERGAFTGAVARHVGKFERANGGTLLLDEIGEMPLVLQSKLLRVLQESEIDRVGAQATTPVDARVIATTNRDLGREVAEGRFREDLFYRINVFPIEIPPLRERRADIPLLVRHFVKKHALRHGKQIDHVQEDVLFLLSQESWRGNVREIENAVERAVLLAEGKELLPAHFAADGVARLGAKPVHGKAGNSVWEMERDLILKTLDEMGGNRTHAAGRLGISLRTLRNKIREYRDAGYPVP
jgi:two-component system response regulator FlrC